MQVKRLFKDDDAVSPRTNDAMTAARITVIATMRITPITGLTASSSAKSCFNFIAAVVSSYEDGNKGLAKFGPTYS